MSVNEIPQATIDAVRALAGNKVGQITIAVCTIMLTGLLVFGIGIDIWREESLNPIISMILTFLLGSGTTLVGAQHGVSTAMQAVTAQSTIQTASASQQAALAQKMGNGTTPTNTGTGVTP